MSHTKRGFVQAIVIRAQPSLNRAPAAIEYAERLWEQLTLAGYGAAGKEGPRESVDWYRKLGALERQFFDRFWRAYGLKKSRNRAAMRWQQMGALKEDQYERVIAAAVRDAVHWRDHAQPGQVRIYAEGWLAERRWEDAGADDGKQSREALASVKKSNMVGEINALRRLYEAAPSDQVRVQLEALQRKLNV